MGEGFSRRLVFDAESIPRVAAAIGDDNPLHHDAAFAAGTRFGGLIASGGHSMAAMLAPTAGFVNERCHSLGLDFRFRLRKAVLAGSTMSAEWRIVAITPSVGLRGHILDMQGVLREAGGEVAIEATCKAVALWPGALGGDAGVGA